MQPAKEVTLRERSLVKGVLLVSAIERSGRKNALDDGKPQREAARLAKYSSSTVSMIVARERAEAEALAERERERERASESQATIPDSYFDDLPAAAFGPEEFIASDGTRVDFETGTTATVQTREGVRAA